MMISTRFAILLALGALPIALSGLVPAALGLGFVYIAVAIVAGLTDFFMTPHSSSLEIERRADEKLSLGAENRVELRIWNRSRTIVKVAVRDEPPYQFTADGNVCELDLRPRETREVGYHVTPHARGDYRFGDIFVRVSGPFGFVKRQYKYPSGEEVKVYPNLIELKKYQLYVRRGRTVETGARKVRLYGRGTEFESLRDYVPDDEFRQVDWKASARRGRLTSRQYQVERSQNVIILLDAGRTMSVQVGEMSKLDHAINSALMLAYVAASGDDKVGMLTFAEKVGVFLPPGKGRAQALAIMQSLYNVPLTTEESDYSGAFLQLRRRWRKRSLVVVFTDLLDPESSRQVILNLKALAANHLCMCVAISDSSVLASARAVPSEMAEVYEKAAAAEVLKERAQAIAELERSGVIVVDSEPGTLSPAVVNRYLEVKSHVRL
jgi:uncharacterized protein (DUF58 family)